MLIQVRRPQKWDEFYQWELFLTIGDDKVYLNLKTNDYNVDPEIKSELISLNPKYVDWLFINRRDVGELFAKGPNYWFQSNAHSDGATKYHKELTFEMQQMVEKAGYTWDVDKQNRDSVNTVIENPEDEDYLEDELPF
tara:strand:- start:49 stop:462 length:414 start_codon:yes stop_codon:yes gene_type:complete